MFDSLNHTSESYNHTSVKLMVENLFFAYLYHQQLWSTIIHLDVYIMYQANCILQYSNNNCLLALHLVSTNSCGKYLQLFKFFAIRCSTVFPS